MKSCLIINTKGPHSTQAAKEAQDATLAFAAFGIPLGVLFMGDGVFQIKRHQHPPPGQKNTAATFGSFELYDINDIYVCEEDLAQRGLSTDDLSISVKPLPQNAINELFTRYHNLLTF